MEDLMARPRTEPENNIKQLTKQFPYLKRYGLSWRNFKKFIMKPISQQYNTKKNNS